MSKTIILMLIACLLAACAPSQQAVEAAITGTQTAMAITVETQQAAIAQTQAALPTVALSDTPEPTSTLTPI
jgi:uncharacterized protein YcfL